jgi:transcriptional regulator with XRE-family HTH domain
MPGPIALGRNLRRFRRLQGIKQCHLAEMLGVSQGSVSRWESGVHEPDDAARERIEALIAVRVDSGGDAALKRLILSSPLRVHLVCDATHRLLAASPGRAAAWRADVGAYLGTSLWRHASAEIIEAEGALAARGWFERPFQTCRFRTGANDSGTIVITPGIMEWESIPLADGRIGRLTTAIEAAAEHHA